MVCMRDAANVSQIMEDEGVVNQRLIINKLDRTAFKKSNVRDLDEVIDTVGVRLLGVVEQDRDIMELSASGKLPKKDSPALLEFSNIAERIMGKEKPLSVYKY